MHRMNKRGMEDKLSYVIWEFIVILMVVIILTVSVRGIANNTTYWKKYHSADLALMTDLVIAGQGNFVINYDIKDLEQNFVTRSLRINQMVFQTLLGDGKFFVYYESIDKDRFPQSHIFARDKGIKIIAGNITSDYIILYKDGKDVGMRGSQLSESIVCPSDDTSGEIGQKNFDIIYISKDTSRTTNGDNSNSGGSDAKAYSEYSSILINTLEKDSRANVNDGENDGNSKDITAAGSTSLDEALFAFADASSQPTTIYYTLHDARSEKMSCLIKKNLLQSFPNMNVKTEPYHITDITASDSGNAANPLETEPFISQREKYIYWIIIDVNTGDVTKEDLGSSIKASIEEFYE